MTDSINKQTKTSAIDANKPYDLILYNAEHRMQCSPGEAIGPLIRTYYVFRYCTKGKGRVVLDSGEVEISAGQSFVISPGQVVTEIADENDPWELSWITLLGIRSGILLKNIGISPKNIMLPWDDGSDFLPCLEAAIDACTGISEESELFRTGHAYIFFGNLINFLRKNYPEYVPNFYSDDYIEKALQFMDLNYTKSIKVSDVAAHVGLNRSYFFTVFKNQLHLSPQEYLTRLRMQKACELFAYPDATVASVANSLNYEPSVFFRHFKRIVGISPSEYKKMLTSDSGVVYL